MAPVLICPDHPTLGIPMHFMEWDAQTFMWVCFRCGATQTMEEARAPKGKDAPKEEQ